MKTEAIRFHFAPGVTDRSRQCYVAVIRKPAWNKAVHGITAITAKNLPNVRVRACAREEVQKQKPHRSYMEIIRDCRDCRDKPYSMRITAFGTNCDCRDCRDRGAGLAIRVSGSWLVESTPRSGSFRRPPIAGNSTRGLAPVGGRSKG